MSVKFVNFLKSRLIFNILLFLNVCKYTFHICHVHISQKVKGVLISSIYYFHIKTKILADFQICIIVLLIMNHLLKVFRKILQNSGKNNFVEPLLFGKSGILDPSRPLWTSSVNLENDSLSRKAPCVVFEQTGVLSDVYRLVTKILRLVFVTSLLWKHLGQVNWRKRFFSDVKHVFLLLIVNKCRSTFQT